MKPVASQAGEVCRNSTPVQITNQLPFPPGYSAQIVQPSSVPSITLPVGDSLWWRRDEYCGGSLILSQYLPSVSSRSLAASPLRQLHCVLKLLAGKIFFEELTVSFRSVTWPRGGRTRRGRSWRGRRTRWTSCARRSPRTRTSWTWRRWGRRCWYRGSSFCHSS